MRNFFCLILCAIIFIGNQKARAQELSGELTEEQFLRLVLENHPMAQQAQNLMEMGEFAVLQARGGFDPYLFSKNKQKFYNGTNYYLYSNSGITLPTRTGIKVQAGYDWNEGEYISRERTLPPQGLWYAGVSVPVLQGLIIDERRAALQQAFIERQNFENEARLLLIDVMLQASRNYWQWVQYKYQKIVVEEAIELAADNFQNFKIAFRQGDKPAVDTLEASIQLQNLSIQNQQLDNDLETARLNLYTFLWGDERNPLEEGDFYPSDVNTISEDQIDSLRATLPIFVQDHPEIRSYEFKMQMIRIDSRLKREKLKPKLDLEYNVLQNPANDISEVAGLDNYNWGLTFSVPLLLRSERGALRLNELKFENANLQVQQKRLEILNKARQYENTFQNISTQLETYQQVVRQYEQLLTAELRKFEMGESSIFLINYRQMSLVDARLKYIELQSKYRYYYRQWLHSLGADTSLWLNE
ncbi:TolC family protein [Marivirga sp. S37H4]|uniref:TolC family protein n=1 Tax=Marivirga aurantiaca TaxID=2802615 RepID=A0A934X1S1_9BACT|nr:TolC family protein [Marivirga aurantiaca]MBK6266731.1 TolC family protein [Marivirga aurantiaca]